MPIIKTEKGWKLGKDGPVYLTRKAAERAYAALKARKDKEKRGAL